jgi:hypothetical protein
MKSTGKKKRRGARTSGAATRTAKRSKKAARKGSRAKTKAAGRKKAVGRKKKGPTRAAAPKRRRRDEGYVVEALVGLQKAPRGPAGLQSGDLQGLSNDEVADSESVDELLEEGNAFEAGIVAGVEDSRDKGGRVKTREVPVDDVPGEYLDKD